MYTTAATTTTTTILPPPLPPQLPVPLLLQAPAKGGGSGRTTSPALKGPLFRPLFER